MASLNLLTSQPPNLSTYPLPECLHGPKPPAPSPSPAELAPAAQRRLREQQQLRERAAARYSALMRSHKGWPLAGGVRPGVVRNWAQLMGGLTHNPPCTGGAAGAFLFV